MAIRYKYDPSSFIGEVFSALTIIGVTKPPGPLKFICKCECGKTYHAFQHALLNLKIKSCGCAQRNFLRKHGMVNHPCYNLWRSMKQRCNNPGSDGYYRYGGRGIKVCKEWEQDFSQFVYDMGERPSSKHTLERIDNDGPYCKENCRWADWKEQTRNKASNRWLEYGNESLCITDWAERLGVSTMLIHARLKKGLTVEQCFESLKIFKNKGKRCRYILNL